MQGRIHVSADTSRRQVKGHHLDNVQDTLEMAPISMASRALDTQPEFVHGDARHRAWITFKRCLKEASLFPMRAQEINEDVRIYAEGRSRHALHRSRTSWRTASQSMCLKQPRSRASFFISWGGSGRGACSMTRACWPTRIRTPIPGASPAALSSGRGTFNVPSFWTTKPLRFIAAGSLTSGCHGVKGACSIPARGTTVCITLPAVNAPISG